MPERRDGKVYYRKLIRDAIPAKIRSKGADCETRVLSDAEFETALCKKVGEEASALPNVASQEELVEELADVLDVIEELKRVCGITDSALMVAQEKNMKKKGGFKEKLFLEWSSDDGHKTNESSSA